MRVYLTNSELATDAGKQLLEITARIAADGKLELGEIKEIWKWLRANEGESSVSAIGYLNNIMARITADRVIDRDEMLELQLAIERVIPTAYRGPIVQARKKRETVRRERMLEARRIEKERERQQAVSAALYSGLLHSGRIENEKEREQALSAALYSGVLHSGQIQKESHARQRRLRHVFAKIAGVTFPNDDGTERQEIITRCAAGEQLILRHDAYNPYSTFATQVLRTNGEQLGHAPEYLAERICGEAEDGFKAVGLLLEITGGSCDKPIRGVNFIAFFIAPEVTDSELREYANNVIATRD